jgi:hypothetical protein
MHDDDFTTIRNHPERSLATALWALQRGLPLGRAMTDLERKTVAVAACSPTHHLTITSKLGRPEFMDRFADLKKRIKRRRGPLIYVGVAAAGLGDGGYHAHLLLWGYQHLPPLHGDLRDLGLGWPHIERIRTRPGPALDALTTTAYVLGQEEPVFGSRKHCENGERPRSKRRFLTPHRATLAKHHPQLLAALDAASDPTVPDEALLSRLPSLDNKDNKEVPRLSRF